MHLLVTRPHPDAERQADELRMRGHDVTVEPVLRVEFLDCGRLPLKGVQALIATSRNGLRALARNEALGMAKTRPLYAVGPASAAMAQSLGFSEIREGAGNAEALAERITAECDPAKGALLHLAGERVAYDLKGELEEQGFAVQQPQLYRTVPAAALSGDLREAIASGKIEGVLLMSPFTARSWATLVRNAGLSRAARALRHFCLSGAVAEGLSELGEIATEVADAPREDALLALITRKTAH